MSDDRHDHEFLFQKTSFKNLSWVSEMPAAPLKEISDVEKDPAHGEGNYSDQSTDLKIPHGKPRTKDKKGIRYKRLSKKSKMASMRASRKKDTVNLSKKRLPISIKGWEEGFVPKYDEEGRRVTCTGCGQDIKGFSYHMRWCRYPRERAEKLKNFRHFS